MNKLLGRHVTVPMHYLADRLEELLRKRHRGLIEVLLTRSVERREVFVTTTIPPHSCEHWEQAQAALRTILEITPQP